MAQIVKVSASKVMRGDVIIHDGGIYTVKSDSRWSADQTHICIHICRAGSYSNKTIEVEPGFQFEALEV